MKKNCEVIHISISMKPIVHWRDASKKSYEYNIINKKVLKTELAKLRANLIKKYGGNKKFSKDEIPENKIFENSKNV